MQLETPRECFDALARHGRDPDPYLQGWSGVWEFIIDDKQIWSVRLDDGRVSVSEGSTGKALASIHIRESDFLRLARGEGHENVITTAVRGALRVEGDIRFAQRLQAVLPIRESLEEQTPKTEKAS
jgi:hypothetical protein